MASFALNWPWMGFAQNRLLGKTTTLPLSTPRCPSHCLLFPPLFAVCFSTNGSRPIFFVGLYTLY